MFLPDHHSHAEREIDIKTAFTGNSGVKAVAGSAHDHHVHNHDHSHGAESGGDLHSWIGVALVLGFVFMLLVDQIGGSIHSRGSAGEF